MTDSLRDLLAASAAKLLANDTKMSRVMTALGSIVDEQSSTSDLAYSADVD